MPKTNFSPWKLFLTPLLLFEFFFRFELSTQIGMATAPAIFRLVGQTKENRGEARVWVETIHVTINDPNFRSLYNNTKQCEMVWIVIRTRVPLLMLAHFLVFFYSASNDQKSYFNTIFHELWINDINPFINMSFSSSKWCYSFYVNSHW